MALFVVRHQHAADRCPAQDPCAGAELLNRLSRPNVLRYGVRIQGEAVVRGEHTMYLIVEADDEAGLRDVMQPFGTVGTVDVYPAATCAQVVAAGGCAESIESEPESVDPEEACQQAIEAGLVLHRAHPLNCETSIPALICGTVMPNAHFYVRNHFHIPALRADTYRLMVGGLVGRPLHLSLHDLQMMPSATAVVTMECAGNGRRRFDPPMEGEPWSLGAVSTAEWTGVPLREVLWRAGVQSRARELVFRGADGGVVQGRPEAIRFERSLELENAVLDDTLLAYAMNGEALPRQHGFPLRLVVPGWYGVASVKWLTAIELVEEPFRGHYQVDKYWYEWERRGSLVREPVTRQRVRALITEPGDNAIVQRGELAIRGVAWSGKAPIARVEVGIGDDWREARLVGEARSHAWQWWELITHLDAPGIVNLSARATDVDGMTQPERAEWNRLGYGNNSIQRLTITIA